MIVLVEKLHLSLGAKLGQQLCSLSTTTSAAIKNDSQMQKLKDIVTRLEDGLFKSAHSKDEYLSLGTLESRLHGLIKRPSPNNPNLVNPNSMITMNSTPGSTMMATSSVDAPMSNMAGRRGMQPTDSNTESLMSSGVMPTQEALSEALLQLGL